MPLLNSSLRDTEVHKVHAHFPVMTFIVLVKPSVQGQPIILSVIFKRLQSSLWGKNIPSQDIFNEDVGSTIKIPQTHTDKVV